jgi:hypothetical protein
LDPEGLCDTIDVFDDGDASVPGVLKALRPAKARVFPGKCHKRCTTSLSGLDAGRVLCEGATGCGDDIYSTQRPLIAYHHLEKAHTHPTTSAEDVPMMAIYTRKGAIYDKKDGESRADSLIPLIVVYSDSLSLAEGV